MSTVAKSTPNPIRTTGAQGFLDWLKAYQPYLFKAVKDKLPKQALSGLGIDALTNDTSAASSTGASPSWLDTIKNLVTAAGTAYLTKSQVDAQKDILDMQLTRARQGLSPLAIDPTTFGLPGPSVNVGLSSDTSKLLMYGGLAAAALLLFSTFMKHGRR